MYLFKHFKILIVVFLLLGSVSVADEQNPQSDKDYFELGNSYYREKSYNRAISNYKRTIKETTDTKLKAWSFYNMGNCYYNKGDKEKARKYYIKSLEIDSLDYDAKYNLELTKNPPKSNNQNNSSNNNKNNSSMSKEEAQDILNRVNQSEKDTKNKSKSNSGQSQSQNQNKSGKGGNKAKGGEKDW